MVVGSWSGRSALGEGVLRSLGIQTAKSSLSPRVPVISCGSPCLAAWVACPMRAAMRAAAG
eukprot:9608392-Prorocentrum_lima.AAC.1